MSALRKRVRLSIDIDPQLRRTLKMVAAARDESLRDYVVSVLEQAVEQDESRAWWAISSRAFARDWESDEDRVYDSLS